MVNIKRFIQKAAVVSSLIKDISNSLPDYDDIEDLDRNYEELYSMILDVEETFDGIFSSVER